MLKIVLPALRLQLCALRRSLRRALTRPPFVGMYPAQLKLCVVKTDNPRGN